MPFRSFHDEFPQVAEQETRTLVVLPDSGIDLPAGPYTFVEMFCDEPGCDCRRVFFFVVSAFRRGPEAVVAWGWEDVEFYEKWMKWESREDALDLKGPVLNLGSPRTDLAPEILRLTREVLLQNSAFVERLKKHYEMFRNKVEAAQKQKRKTGRKARLVVRGCH